MKGPFVVMAEARLLVLCVLVLSLYFGESLGSSDDEDLRQQYNMVVNEVADLKETIETMREDMRRLKRVSRALDVLCEEWRSGEDDVECTSNSKVPDTQDSGIPAEQNNNVEEELKLPFPVQATTYEISNGTFKVGYQSSVKMEAIIVSNENNIEPTQPQNSFANGTGIVSGEMHDETHFVLQADNYGIVLVIESVNDTSTSLPTMNFTTNVTSELFFESGNSVAIKLIVDRNKTRDIHLGLYTPNENKTNIVDYWGDEYKGMVNRTEVKEYLDHSEITFVVNGDKKDHEGILYLSMSDHRTNIAGLSYLGVNQIFELKRSDHTEPFKKGFIGFVTYLFDNFDTKCQFGLRCMLYVSVIGNQPTGVSLWRVHDDVETLSDIPWQNILYANYNLAARFFLLNTSKEDAGRYLYRATSDTGSVIEKEFEVKVVTAFKLFRNQSQVVKNTRDELVVRCVGQGYPNPEIRFYNSSYAWYEYRIHPGPGVSIEPSEVENDVIETTLTLDGYDIKSSTYTITCAVDDKDFGKFNDGYEVFKKT